ncbi:ROK family protein [Candidatus Enterococcus ferrettii]|uniref:ROK family protein n=1 Tax=Candidatus Enterococcus ferrettii TaxID=2815324 RepID=A0ABV0EUF7_9ENTE|nr:ROK family protein [Enterococcus sp. 665A]
MDYLSIDVGGTYIKYSLVNRAGNLLTVKKIETPATLEQFLADLFQLIGDVREQIKGIGISLPGKIDIKKGVIYHGGSLEYMHEVGLKALVEEEFGIPCALSNDGKAAALAELWLGNLNEIENGAAVVLGTGIGGGLILNGELFQGSHFQAGELSFLINYQQLEDPENLVGWHSSAVRFVIEACKLLGLENLNDGQAVFEALEQGQNDELQKMFTDYCQIIARILLNLQATLDISRVVIGGGISAQNRLIKEINQQYQLARDNQPLLKSSFEPLEILPCHFRSEANLLGAIYQLFLQLDNA